MKFNSLGFSSAILIICFFSFCKPKQTIVKPAEPVVQKKDTVKSEINIPKPVEHVILDINIGFLMPFYFNENLQEPTSDLEEPELIANSVPALQFYEGVKMAVDSFKNETIKINYKFFDSSDSARLETLIKGIRIYDSDLLFVNTPTNNLTPLVKGATQNKTLMVYSMASSIRNEYLVTCLPNNQTMIKEMSAYISRHFNSAKILVVYRDAKKDKELGELFSGQIDSSLAVQSGNEEKCSRINFTTEKLDGLLKKLDKTKKNLIVMTSSDEAFISPIINQLAEKTVDYRLQVCGLPTWENFETVSVPSLEKLETIIFTSNYINYEDAEIQQFRKEFLKIYYSDPLLQAYHGFYLMKGYLKAMERDKKYWADLSKSPDNFNSAFFNFTSGNSKTGFENRHISVLKFSDYNLKLQPE